jgi:subtilisin family serine protease
MKKLLAVLIAITAAAPLFAQTKTRYLISIHRPAAAAGLRMLRDPIEFTSHDVRTFTNVDFIAADLTETEAAALRKSADVDYLSPVIPRSINGTAPRMPFPDARPQRVPYGIDLVHARDIWKYTRGKGPVNVAIVDTGIDYTHPDLKDRYAGGYNVYTKTNDPKDDHGHGTHVAGTIGASDNDIGVVGVAPEVRIWSVKVLQANGSGTDETVMAGMDWVINKKNEIGGNWIINLSLGAAQASPPERETFARAIDNGILVVAAAGNRGARSIDYPGAYDQVVAVSAIDDKSELADFSSWGPGVAFAGPGVNVLSSVRVGSAQLVEIDAGDQTIRAFSLQGSQNGEVHGTTIFCGLGKPEEIPADVKGKIAIVQRGDIRFHDKAQNLIKAGAVAVIIVPTDARNDMPTWTLLPPVCNGLNCTVDPADASYPWGVVLSTTKKDGEQLVTMAGKEMTATNVPDDYQYLSGTSMATPHVVGTAALVWTLAPNLSAQDIRLALKLSAFDLGDAGYDFKFGYGRIDAVAAAKYVAPNLFGLPPTTAPVPTRRRPSSPHH